MESSLDLQTVALVVAVVALIVWYFWHVAASIINGSKVLNAFLDGRAERQRQELQREAQFGPYPLWYRAAQKLILAILFVGFAYFMWKLVQG